MNRPWKADSHPWHDGGYLNGKLRIGILGFSDIARRKFLPAVAASENAALLAIGSSRWDAASALNLGGADHQLLAYEDLIAHPALHLIYISLPNHLHEEWVVRALEQGKHVICEKPVGLSASSVRRMIDCAEEKGLLLFENLMFLHHPLHGAVKNVIDRGEIGRISAIRSVFCFPCPPAGNFRLDPAKGGGAFHDLARYAVGSAWYFLRGRCESFSGYMLDHKGLNVAIHGIALTTAQEIFSYALAFGQPYECSYEIVGEQGSIRVDRAYTTPADMANHVHVMSGGRDASFTVPPADHFLLMIEDVCAMIQRGSGFQESHVRMLQLAEMAERMEKGCHHEELRH